MKDYRLSNINFYKNTDLVKRNIDKPIKTPSKDDIILAVKQTIGSLGTLDETTETLTLDCSDIDNIAEMIAEKFCGGEE